jgi:hypothetical protein
MKPLGKREAVGGGMLFINHNPTIYGTMIYTEVISSLAFVLFKCALFNIASSAAA